MIKSNTPKEYLRNLMQLLLKRQIEVNAFCEQFENIYNFDLEKSSLSKKEQEAFRELFNKVIYYSPFPDERKKIPNYLSEEEIVKATEIVWNKFIEDKIEETQD